jgi:hypothetical protein
MYKVIAVAAVGPRRAAARQALHPPWTDIRREPGITVLGISGSQQSRIAPFDTRQRSEF